MSIRLLLTTLQLHKNVHSVAKILQFSVRSPVSLFQYGCIQMPQQQLHIKIYDKDAGLDEQREANKCEYRENALRANVQKEIQYDEAFEPSPHSAGQYAGAIVGNTNDSMADNPDIFGNANDYEESELDAGDAAEEEFLHNPVDRSKQLSIKRYATLIKEHLNAHRVKDAIDVLEERMLKEDRVKPDSYIYNLLIGGCAKAGYSRKAFNLFTRMRQRGLKVTGGTYTSLFNACATTPFVGEGLKQATHLRETMLEKGYEPNVANYNAMIKAYGRCGDVATAYMLVDEMLERGIDMNASTFNFLLQACASDRENGFRHCLLTWHKMLDRCILPDYYSFSTVLRCVRDCGFGDLTTMHKVINQIVKEHNLSQIGGWQKQQIERAQPCNEETSDAPNNKPTSTDVNTQPESEPQEEQHQQQQQQQQQQPSSNALQLPLTDVSTNTSLQTPNLLAKRPHLGSLISISDITQSHDRFLLLGGLNGFLDLMKQYNITPDIKCFTLMLEVIPPTYSAEKQLLMFVRKIGLKADIDFFNVLIKKRSMRFQYEGAKEVLNMIRTAGLRPDIVTYGVLALGCQTAEEARELLERMRSNDIRCNTEILGAMLRQGCEGTAFPYIREILQISLDENIKPNAMFLTHLHKFYKKCARAIDARRPFTKTKSYKREHAKFCEKLRLWYEEQGISDLKLEDAIKKLQEHPYKQFKDQAVAGVEPLKNEKFARKQKERKYIKKIKIANLRDDNNADNAQALQKQTERIE